MKPFYEHREEKVVISPSGSLWYEPHLHEHIELVYMKKGRTHAFAGGVDCELEPGDFFVVFPNSVHYYDDCRDDESIVVIVSAAMMPEYKELFFGRMPVYPVIKGVCSEAGKLMEMSVKFAETEGEKSENKGILRGLLLAIFGMILPKMEFKTERSKKQSVIQDILEYCEKNFKNEISIQSVADALHLSCSCISHSFSEKIHMGFREYINYLRLNEARELLEVKDLNITEVATEAGFETIRTFNRVFKERYGITPFEYRKKINKKSSVI